MASNYALMIIFSFDSWDTERSKQSKIDCVQYEKKTHKLTHYGYYESLPNAEHLLSPQPPPLPHSFTFHLDAQINYVHVRANTTICMCGVCNHYKMIKLNENKPKNTTSTIERDVKSGKQHWKDYENSILAMFYSIYLERSMRLFCLFLFHFRCFHSFYSLSASGLVCS